MTESHLYRRILAIHVKVITELENSIFQPLMK